MAGAKKTKLTHTNTKRPQKTNIKKQDIPSYTSTKKDAAVNTELSLNSITNSRYLKTAKTRLKNLHPSKRAWAVGIILIILLLAYYKKNLFIAATVNGVPITNLELLSRESQLYRQKTLNDMINEQIITQEASRNGITVSDAEVNQAISDLEKQFGGEAQLNMLLAQQGEDMNYLRSQTKIKLTIEKLYSPEASVSAAEVKQFINQNKNQMPSSNSAEQVKFATEQIKQQKIFNQIFPQKFQELKQASKVVTY